MIKLDGFLDIIWYIDYILVFFVISLNMVIKYPEHTDEIIRIIGEAPSLFTIGHVK